MSGPIIRKYGFPNFEKIFGERKLEHGVGDDEKSESKAGPDQPPMAPARACTSPDKSNAAHPTEAK